VSAGRDICAAGYFFLLHKKINRSDPEMDATLMAMQRNGNICFFVFSRAFGFKICKECNMTQKKHNSHKLQMDIKRSLMLVSIYFKSLQKN
jgi:hypothetical protein